MSYMRGLALVLLGFWRPVPGDLPVPDLTGFEAAVRTQIEQALGEARALPDHPAAVGRVAMLLHAYQLELAEPWYAAALRLEPRSLRWTYLLGILQAALGRSDAVRSLRTALELDPDYLPARLGLAERLLAEGALDDSRGQFEDAVRRAPDSAAAHYGLGRARSQAGNRREAIAAFRRAVELAPDFAAAHYGLAREYVASGDRKRAAEHFARYERHRDARRRPPDPLLHEVEQLRTGSHHYLNEGLRLQKLGRLDEARARYAKAAELEPGFVQAHVNLLAVAVAQGRREDADRHYRSALRLAPEMPELHFNRGLDLVSRGERREAIAAFRRALEGNPHYAEAHYNLAALLEAAGNADEALRHYRFALEAKPNYPLARFGMARVLLAGGRPRDAIPELLLALETETSDRAMVLYTLADACARAGNLATAVHYAEEAVAQARAEGRRDLATRIERELREARWASRKP